MRFVRPPMLTLFLMLSLAASASVVGSVRGVIHDPQHRPVPDAMVMIKAKTSDWAATANSDANGNFAFNPVPLGEYVVTVVGVGFEQAQQDVMVISGSQPVLHFALNVAGAKETINVSGAPEEIPTDTATPTTVINRLELARTPGAARTNSLAMITNFVPGAYVTHDQLHIRGGHQTSWLVDGVPVPNTNIASNIGPQFDPKDIDYLEVSRGSYGAEFGDRTYGVFNVVPRTGFERNRQAELVLSAGNFYQTNDQFSFGSHTDRFAYYASVNGNRSNLGIETPIPQPVRDAENGYGGFGSFIFNVNPSNQLRLVTSLRRDYYQIPYDPNFNDQESAFFDSAGLRDGDHESDAIVNFSWVHTFNSKLLLTVSPFYHSNAAHYDSALNDYPTASTDHQSSTYAGGQASFSANLPGNNLQLGFYGFGQRDSQDLAVVFNCPLNGDPNFPQCGGSPFTDHESPSGSIAAFFLDDKVKPFPWITLSAGIRPTHFSGGVTETSISPRFGVALNVPHLNWIFRGSYGHYYQPPPLITASGPLLQFANSNNLTFTALHGERDEEEQFGVTIPWRGWILDANYFRTNAQNFFDHNNVGESNLFFPLTIQNAIVRGWELTLRSPRIAHRGQLHLSYSNQVARAGGFINGGLTDFSFLDWGPLDHDQRNTLNLGGDVSLPHRAYASTNLYYGSGFTNAFPGQPYPGNYLPQHTTFDLTVGKDFGERFSASVSALNVANRRVQLDNSVTFGGFHWNNPREVFIELRYRFHY
ncbi:MAG TPA: TonB-dependent receptor [Candidatus Dormibacteraeota bacterium]|nr:TonB-dependent receptor [Candidatus Dormibacteraeota bacterium]